MDATTFQKISCRNNSRNKTLENLWNAVFFNRSQVHNDAASSNLEKKTNPKKQIYKPKNTLKQLLVISKKKALLLIF